MALLLRHSNLERNRCNDGGKIGRVCGLEEVEEKSGPVKTKGAMGRGEGFEQTSVPIIHVIFFSSIVQQFLGSILHRSVP